jgi:hypothetical protein
MSDYVGAYRLKKVDIKGQDGKEADITKLVLEINVNAYVTQPTYTIVVTVRDNRNLINKLPLRGGQNINIEIEYGNEIKTWNAVIGSINDIENNDHEQSYSLKCYSPLLIKSNFFTISKHFEGSLSNIAKDIFNQHKDSTEKIGLWDDSLNSESVIIPDWSPINSILWLASRAKSKISDTRFFFFQDSFGKYNFTPLERLNSVTDEPQKFVYGSEKFHPTEKTKSDMITINKYEANQSYDILETAKNGYLAGSLFDYNTTSKSFQTIEHKFKFNKEKSDNEKSLWGEYTPPGIGKRMDSISRFSDDEAKRLDKLSDVSRITKTNYRKSNNILDITIPGNPITDIGQLIEIKIPQASPREGQDITDYALSGKYVTMSKRQVFTSKTSFTVLQCIRESASNGAYE